MSLCFASLALDTNMRGQSVAQTVISSAQDPEAIMTFNYASEALNNSFFLQGLVSILSF